MTHTELIDRAIQEDSSTVNESVDTLFSSSEPSRVRLVAQEDLVLSGTEIFTEVISRFDPKVQMDWKFADGDFVVKEQTICTLKVDLKSLIQAERVALKFVGHLSGVATLTRCFLKQLEGTRCQLVSTQETLPGLRAIEHEAFVHGKVSVSEENKNHLVLSKSHYQMAGGLKAAVKKIRVLGTTPIATQVMSLEQIKDAVSLNVEKIILQDFAIGQIKKAVELIPANIETEYCGNITLEQIREVAASGVNRIGVSTIAHSAPFASFTLTIE